MRSILTPVKMAIINKSTNKWWGGCGKRELVYCWWECRLVQPLWKTVWNFLRKLKMELFKNFYLLIFIFSFSGHIFICFIFLLLFNYSCSHFPPITLSHPTHPHLPHSVLPTPLPVSMGHSCTSMSL